MESRSRTLHQQRAALSARQGDPESPASGTLFARQQRLQAELAQATADQTDVHRSGGGMDSARASVSALRRSRPTFLIQRDLWTVQKEIDAVQSEIDVIDRQILKSAKKNRG